MKHWSGENPDEDDKHGVIYRELKRTLDNPQEFHNVAENNTIILFRRSCHCDMVPLRRFECGNSHHVRRVKSLSTRRGALGSRRWLPALTNASEPLATALSQWPRCPA